MKARKLLPLNALNKLWEYQKIGIPYQRMARDYKLSSQISLPVFINLVETYDAMVNEDTESIQKVMYDSLFPPWLYQSDDYIVQEQPQEWRYIGRFPLGTWEKR